MVLPIVVFPHPDSPTRPNVSPSYSLKLTPSIALYATFFWKCVNNVVEEQEKQLKQQ